MAMVKMLCPVDQPHGPGVAVGGEVELVLSVGPGSEDDLVVDDDEPVVRFRVGPAQDAIRRQRETPMPLEATP